MYSFLPERLAIVCLAFVLSACGTQPLREQTIEPDVAPALTTSSASAVASATQGSIVQLPANNPLGVSEVRVIDDYRAASGRLCRRVQLPGKDGSVRVLCQRDYGQWSYTRALVTSQASDAYIEPFTAAASSRPPVSSVPSASGALPVSSVPPDPRLPQASSVPPVQLRMQAGETLWRFAARTTGRSENWERIAAYNGIGDAGRVQSGSVLKVPADLYADSN